MWIAEEIPADPDAPDARPARTVLAYRDRKGAAKAMSNHLKVIGQRRGNSRVPLPPGAGALYYAAGEAFEASARCPVEYTPEIRINGRIYRLRHTTD